jgi:hypothetical protein
LVGAGHQLDRIRRYTLAEIKGYLTAIGRQDAQRMEHSAQHAVVALGAAMSGA